MGDSIKVELLLLILLQEGRETAGREDPGVERLNVLKNLQFYNP